MTKKKFEKSSGGIVYRKKGNEIQILLLKWRNSKQNIEYVIPKGHIEDGEIAKQSAVREIGEEAGLDAENLEIIKFITKINYTFKAGHLENKPLIDKDVYIFLVKYTGHKEPKIERQERFVGYEWISIDKIDTVSIKFDLAGIVNKNKVYFI